MTIFDSTSNLHKIFYSKSISFIRLHNTDNSVVENFSTSNNIFDVSDSYAAQSPVPG
jgi:hypothetical protein